MDKKHSNHEEEKAKNTEEHKIERGTHVLPRSTSFHTSTTAWMNAIFAICRVFHAWCLIF